MNYDADYFRQDIRTGKTLDLKRLSQMKEY